MLSPIHALCYVRFTEFTEFNESLLHQKIRQMAILWVNFLPEYLPGYFWFQRGVGRCVEAARHTRGCT